jgi:hypothetical protein
MLPQVGGAAPLVEPREALEEQAAAAEALRSENNRFTTALREQKQRRKS